MPSMGYDAARKLTERFEGDLRGRLGDGVSRRAVLGGAGTLGAAALGASGSAGANGDHENGGGHDDGHGNFGAVGEYDDGFDPHAFLREFDTGEVVGEDEADRPIREFELVARDVPIEIVPGVEFLAWTYNGQVPGPTLRAIEGERIRVTFTNRGTHAHTIHPHLKNLDPAMDGIPQNGPGVLETDESYTYEWIAQPAGCHFYHCHSMPLKEHIHRGLYGALIVDPDPDRVRESPAAYTNHHPSQITPAFEDDLVAEARSRNHTYDENDGVDEMVMVMNGFDTNFDGDNEVYAANTRAFAYGVGSTDGKGNWEAGETKRPIQINKNERQRIYLLNTIEFDLINSFHTHSQFFDYYDHGTTLTPTHKTIDTVMQCQAQRGIVELDYSEHEPGLYMFHAHQSEFAELGWMSFFEVV
jgi:FtsP/CotA-like multicopper oxidase with cupredoxin domain